MKTKCKVLITKDNDIGVWVARGLEYDICVRGNSLGKTIENFKKMICCEYSLAEQLGKKFKDCVPEAPRHIWDIYKENIKDTDLPPIVCKDMPVTSPAAPFILKPCLAL